MRKKIFTILRSKGLPIWNYGLYVTKKVVPNRTHHHCRLTSLWRSLKLNWLNRPQVQATKDSPIDLHVLVGSPREAADGEGQGHRLHFFGI